MGDIITYAFTITNTGNVPLVGPFQVLDSSLIPSSLSCPDAVSLGVGETIVCNASYQTVPGDIGTGVWNTSSVSAQYNSQTVTSNEATVYVCYNPPATPMPDRLDCSQFTFDDTCIPHPECEWNYPEGVCKNKP